MGRSRVAAAFLVAMTLLLSSACGDQAGGNVGSPTGSATGPTIEPTTGPTGPTVGPVQGPSPVWLAAFRVEADPNALDDDIQAVKDAVGPAIFAGPVACFQGFPADFAPTPDAYVLGVIAPTREELDQAVQRAGRTPIFVKRMTIYCVD